MTIAALSYIYGLSLLMLISIPVILGGYERVRLGRVVSTVLINMIEAGAVLMLYAQSDYAHATAAAVFMWALELIAISLVIRRVNRLYKYTGLQVLSSLLFIALTVIPASLLAFG